MQLSKLLVTFLTLFFTTVTFGKTLVFQENSFLTEESIYQNVNSKCYAEYFNERDDDSNQYTVRALDAQKKCPLYEYELRKIDYYELMNSRFFEQRNANEGTSVYTKDGLLTTLLGRINDNTELRVSQPVSSSGDVSIKLYLFSNGQERDQVPIAEHFTSDGGSSSTIYFLNENLVLYVFSFTTSNFGYHANYWKKYQVDLSRRTFQLMRYIGCGQQRDESGRVKWDDDKQAPIYLCTDAKSWETTEPAIK